MDATNGAMEKTKSLAVIGAGVRKTTIRRNDLLFLEREKAHN